jgi:hypothetical protein
LLQTEDRQPFGSAHAAPVKRPTRELSEAHARRLAGAPLVDGVEPRHQQAFTPVADE